MTSSRLRKLLIPLILLALLGTLAWSLNNRQAAPDVKFVTLSGQQITMDQLRGKIVLVNFWATTCPGCIAEMHKLVDTFQRYHARGFEVVAVAMSYDPPDHVANYSEKHALPFPVALDIRGDVATAFNEVNLTPTAFVIDKNGRIVRHVVGDLDFAGLHTMLDNELGRAS